ncbi:MAG: response regulator transcription factor [Opitutaceae bacterium]|nr:response regulator transcription factor [Opitutaceae bacterium]
MTIIAKQSVWLIEDNATLRHTVARAIAAIPGFACAAQFQRCEDALGRLGEPDEARPDVILLDVGLPGMSGIDGIALLKQASPRTQVVILTVFDDDDKIYRAICAGASGYLLKGAPLDDLAAALDEVSRGGSPMTPRVARRVLEMFSRLAPRETALAGLSPRERQIIEGMVDGLTNKEIAERLGLSAHTTDGYTRAIYEKLHVNTRSGAVAKAMRDRLF